MAVENSDLHGSSESLFPQLGKMGPKLVRAGGRGKVVCRHLRKLAVPAVTWRRSAHDWVLGGRNSQSLLPLGGFIGSYQKLPTILKEQWTANGYWRVTISSVV